MVLETLGSFNISLPDIDSFTCGAPQSALTHPTITLDNPSMLSSSPVFHVRMSDLHPGKYEEPRVIWDALYQPIAGSDKIDENSQLISHHLMPATREFLGICPEDNLPHKYFVSVRPSYPDGSDYVSGPNGFALISSDGAAPIINKFLYVLFLFSQL